MLQKLGIYGAQLEFGSSILSLLQLKRLRVLCLRSVELLDTCSTAHFAELIPKFGMFRPEVTLDYAF